MFNKLTFKMKRLILISSLLLTVISATAQSKSFHNFYNSFNGREGYTTIEMSGKMLSMINVDGEGVDSELAKVFNKVKRLMIVVVDHNNDEFTAAINKLINSPEYEMLTSVNNEGVAIKLYAADDQREFLMYVSDPDNSLMLSIYGEKLTMKQLTQFTKIIKVN